MVVHLLINAILIIISFYVDFVGEKATNFGVNMVKEEGFYVYLTVGYVINLARSEPRGKDMNIKEQIF